MAVRRQRTRRLLMSALGAGVALALAAAPPVVRAAEWTAPPGINVAAQEQTLKDRVRRLAERLVGDNVIDVIANVGYVRLAQAGTGAAPDRVKLPGFNNYIVPSDQEAEIVSEFARVRQVFVVVSDDVTIPPSSLARDLTRLAGLNPTEGDTLRVITAPRQARPGGPPVDMTPGFAERPPEPEGEPEAAEPMAERPRRPVEPLPMAEARSTAHLMKARRHYFAGDYQGALEEILEAVRVNPESAEGYAMLGSLYYAMNWNNLAIKYWERSLQLNPDNREIEDLVTQVRVQGP